MELVAVLSKGEGTWGQVSGLAKKGEWERIVLIGPNYASEFKLEGIPFDFVEYDENISLVKLKEFLQDKLKDKFSSFNSEVAISIASGSGKEHMALISALLAIPVGVRFTALTAQGVIFL
jgi:hypothetical protein